MNLSHLRTAAVCLALSTLFHFSAFSQLSDGSAPPEFVYDDLEGNTHDLYAYLAEGKTVIMFQFASWAGPCWNYYQDGALQALHEDFGPDGSDQIVVLMVESDTSQESPLDGSDPSWDIGDWLTGNPLPVIQPTDELFMEEWELAYFPTIYTICPSGSAYESGQVDFLGHLEAIDEYCGGFSVDYNLSLDGSPYDMSDCVGTPGVLTVVNTGQFDASGYAVEVSVNGVVQQTTSPSETLVAGASTTVEVDDLGATGGDEVTATLVWDLDELSIDNTTSTVINNFVEGTNRLRVSLQTDSYPTETSWELLDNEGNVILDQSDEVWSEGTNYVYEYYLTESSCYTFRFLDTFGDGLNGSSWGAGNVDGWFDVSLLDADGEVVATVLEDDGTAQWFELEGHLSVTEMLTPAYEICVFHDWNENGSWDPEEPTVPGIPVTVDDVTYETGESGCISVEAASVSSIGVLQDTEVWPLNTTPATLTFAGVANTAISFGISPNDPNYNMGLSYTQLGDYFCNFETPLWIQVENQGNSPVSGSLGVTIDPLLTIVDWTGDGTLDGAVITWDIVDMPVGATWWYTVTVESPSFEAMGELATNSASLQVYNPEGEVIEVIHEVDEHIITCSYDPNDKQVWPAGETDNGYLPVEPTTLEYLVRFQNTGNAAAFNIRVDDDLDPNLDWSTYEVIATSHYCEPSIDMSNGHIEWYFPDIMLPDSTANEPESHGFIRYRVATGPAVYEGMTVENTAYIYFDFNPAVITNTTLNTFSDEYFTGIEETEGLTIGTFPNPAEDRLTVTLRGARVHQLSLIGLDGKTVLTQRPKGPQTTLSLDGLAEGLYLLRATDAQGHTLATTRVVKR